MLSSCVDIGNLPGNLTVFLGGFISSTIKIKPNKTLDNRLVRVGFAI